MDITGRIVDTGSNNLQLSSSYSNARAFVASKMFNNLFAHGMELVEETATYLDNEGREACKSLDRTAALCYAGVSMRLTTSLMQIASWLLVLRAVREGEMSCEEAAQAKYRLRDTDGAGAQSCGLSGGTGSKDLSMIPDRLIELVDQTSLIFNRLVRIDADLFISTAPVARRDGINAQLDALKAAFPEN